MYLRSMKNYQPMSLVHTTDEGTELWLGDYYAATDVMKLKQKNIKSVLTAAAMLGVRYSKEQAINHKVINAFDIPSYKMTPHFDQSFHFIKEGLKNGNVLVHCAAGISRSTTCVLVYLMREKGYSFAQSFQSVKKKRPIVNPNYGFQSELAKYEIALKKKNLSSQNQERKAQKKSSFAQQVEEEKNAFILFSKNDIKLNKTVGYSQIRENFRINSSQKARENSVNKTSEKVEIKPKLHRGESLNHKKIPSYQGFSQVHNQYFQFPMEQPKIVTIKK